jgi:hypothetical protein
MAIPWSVLDSPSYARLSHPSRSLLFEMARQFVGDNNGRLLASFAYLYPRGWRSADVISRAKKQLLRAGFLHETVMGHRPNKASWYAVTWRALDRLHGYDPGTALTFVRGAYRWANGDALIPAPGPTSPRIAPPGGQAKLQAIPPDGAVLSVLERGPSPGGGHHLEMPSPSVEIELRSEEECSS